jgi:hypothetical protein
LIEAVPVQIVLALKYDDLGGDIVYYHFTKRGSFQALAALMEKTLKGIGLLELEMLTKNDTGTLNSSITICTKSYTLSAEDFQSTTLSYIQTEQGEFYCSIHSVNLQQQ